MRKYLRQKHLMIDIETLGTSSDAVVLSIAAVPFAFEKTPDLKDAYHVNVENTEAIEIHLSMIEQVMVYDRTVEMSCLNGFWRNPDKVSPFARDGIITGQCNAVTTLVGLNMLREFVLNYALGEPPIIWAQGANFDFRLLASLAEVTGTEAMPWAFWQERDSRSILSGFDRDFRAEVWDTYPALIPHRAKDDVVAQAVALGMAITAMAAHKE